MERVTFRADSALLERARRAARERGATFTQLMRDALERELASPSGLPPPLRSVGVVSTRGHRTELAYKPDRWR